MKRPGVCMLFEQCLKKRSMAAMIDDDFDGEVHAVTRRG